MYTELLLSGTKLGSDSSLNSRSVNDGKVTDHHALIITENLPGKLETDEQAVYELIAGRMLEAFSENVSKTLPV